MSARTRRLVPAVLALVAVAALVAACSSSSGSDLTGKTWALTTITEKSPAFAAVVPVDQQDNYTVMFNSDGTAAIKADCNGVQGTWTVGPGGSLAITPGASTQAACGPDSMGSQFVAGLANTASYVVSGSTLSIALKDGGTLGFRVSQDPWTDPGRGTH
jgi:heat shock protein HslJ